MEISLNACHGRHGCQWTVRHDQCTTWTWDGVPSTAMWLAGVGACCEATGLAQSYDTFRSDLDVQFGRIVSSIRGSATCDLCWPDISSRRQMAAAAAANRNAEAERGMTYATARKRYMETGTIADKEAMVAFVTGTEPDLEKLGSEWEPARRAPAVTQRRAALAFLLAALVLAIAGGLLPAVHLLAPLALACVLIGYLLTGRPRARR